MAADANSTPRHRPTESLILPTPRLYYRASIHTEYAQPSNKVNHGSNQPFSSHWQLRSMISSPEQDVVYYPSGSDIYALYTKTRERQIITRLPFSPRCLVAGNGWLCCGGVPGHYTAIPLRDSNTNFDLSSLGLESGPDARLPLDLDPSRRSTPSDIPPRRRRSHTHPVLANVKPVGKDINNCITLWFPSEISSNQTYTTPVAVVANNDKTISIVDLKDPDADVVEKLTYPDCVNRAVMSPDGELLVAVLDDPFLYVHHRQPVPKSSARYLEQTHEWTPACRIQLESQRQADPSNFRGSFAVSFSSSGKYLAVGTQYGVISVFDTETLTLEDSEPLVIFTTSRPMDNTATVRSMDESGAVRSMEFSPGPFDLLAWTEASGRAGVADVRDLFVSRQLLVIDSRGDGMERVSVSERSADPVIDPRLRSSRSLRTGSPGNATPDYLGVDFERRQLSNLTQELLDRHHSPLTPEQMDILQAHRVARRQRDAEAEGSETAGWSPWAGPTSTTDTPTNGEGSSSSERRISTVGFPAALRDFVNPERSSSSSFRSFINDRNQDRERRSQPESGESSTARNETGRDSRPWGYRPTTSRLIRIRTPAPSNPWAEVDSLYRARSPPVPTITQPTRESRPREERQERQEWERSQIRQQEQEDEEHELEQDLEQAQERRQNVERRSSHRPPPRRQPWRGLDDLGLGNFDENIVLRGVLRTGPSDTMGCCWSPDGRIL